MATFSVQRKTIRGSAKALVGYKEGGDSRPPLSGTESDLCAGHLCDGGPDISLDLADACDQVIMCGEGSLVSSHEALGTTPTSGLDAGLLPLSVNPDPNPPRKSNLKPIPNPNPDPETLSPHPNLWSSDPLQTRKAPGPW